MLRTMGLAAAALTMIAGPALAASLPESDPLAPQPIAQSMLVNARHYSAPRPDVLGTVAVDAGVTLYDARFRRVAAADRNDPRVAGLAAGLTGLSPYEMIAGVRSAVAGRVRYASDFDTIGVSDYWSSAGETLARGAGDDADIAIVEMQVLKAAGYNPQDLMLSVGRYARRGTHVVLLARTPQGFFMLDQAEDRLVPAARADGRFTPVMTIAPGHSWIHGYRVGQRQMAGR